MIDPPASIVGVAPAAARAYLINVAETIQNILLPQLDEKVATRAIECLRTVIRVAAHLVPPESALNELASDIPHEAGALESVEAEATKLLESITQVAKPPGRSFDQVKLENFLRTHPLGGQYLRVTRASQLQGGRSKQTILVWQQGARELPAEIVIRQDWAGAVTGTSVFSEFEVLKRVSAAGLRVPKPLLLETSEEALGAPFIVVTRISGKLEGDPFTPPNSEKAVLELAEQLGGLHALKVEDFVGLPGISERSYTAEQIRSDLVAYRGVVDKFGLPSSTVDYAFAWLDRNVARVSSPRTLVHGDLGFHNFLCENGHLTAILDWELAHIGSPARDLGYLKSVVEQATTWTRFMERYRTAGGPEVSAFAVDFYTLFSSLWLYQLLLQARAGITAGVVHDMEITFICAHFIPALLVRLSRELQGVLGRELSA